ncbi:NO-inducible flavohemoprotein [Vibrio tritonius]|uniref:NO-inducible flavohemoprotein n=1 Tax=Vibrio tritonius TaxID=1435069 RepID=UPI000838280A|nr:NO-inducible flavohemoprotein [Vibrio tritonius]
MLSEHHIAVIKNTIPLLASAGPELTRHFYQRMLSQNPELKHIFNLSHQKSGRQSVALFEAIAAYAKNIDNLAALTSAVERIAHKHTSFNIKPEHYQIVGYHLIETLRELAGEAFTNEVEEAWTAAYLFLAEVFIQREEQIYTHNEYSVGGWRGKRRFVVSQMQRESQSVISFILVPEDGEAVMDYLPGQYLGVEVTPPDSSYREIRQYSLCSAPNGHSYRIAVKKLADQHGGAVSRFMHEHLYVGSVIDVYPPAGDFYYQERNKPVVFISAGVGVTPIQAMLHSAAKTGKAELTYLYACPTEADHVFRQETEDVVSKHGWRQQVWYEQGAIQGQNSGLMNLTEQTFPEQADFYLCGPLPFMQHIIKQLLTLGIASESIHYEVFGPFASADV